MIKLLEKIYQENKDCIITFEKVRLFKFFRGLIFRGILWGTTLGG